MGMKLNRKEILDRLKKEIREKRPILGAGCSTGLIAKCAELGKTDLIIVYSTGKSRVMGLPTTMTMFGNSNFMTLEMYDELANVVKNTPIIAGIEANDHYCLDLEVSLRRFLDKGFNGVINFPTVGLYENLIDGGMAFRKYTEKEARGYGVAHWGWSREVEMIRMLHDWDVFTMAYVLSPADAKEMAEAGADVICPHVGPTMGGLAGFTPLGGLDELLKKAQEMMEAAKKVNPDVICLVHGGPFYSPESTKAIYEKTDAQGFVGASSIERIPVEKAVINECKGYKSIPMTKPKEK
jgi:predicted TIM-barrel enzyme